MELTDRKRQILKIVVEEYVAAAEPVGTMSISSGRMTTSTGAILPKPLSSDLKR